MIRRVGRLQGTRTLTTSRNPFLPAITPSSLGRDTAQVLPQWASTCWADCEQKLKDQSEASTHPTTRVLDTIDDVSEQLCAVLDSCSCCAATHGDGHTRQVAEQTYLSLYDKVQTINLNQDLYRALVQEHLQRQGLGKDDDAEETERVSAKLMDEFEWEGAGLAQTKDKQKVGALQNRIRSLQAELETSFLTLDSRRASFKLSQNVMITNSEENFQHVMGHPSIDRDTKRELYRQRYRSDFALDDLASKRALLRSTRQDLARILNFPSFADLAIHKNMAGKPQVVRDFLERLACELKPIVRAQTTGGQGEEWEVARSLSRSDSQNSQNSRRRIDGFFTVERCLQGLERIAKQIFHVDARWDRNVNVGNAWKASTTCWEMHVEGDGVLYLDLFARKGKAAGAALYQLRTRKIGGAATSHSAAALLSCSFSCTNASNPAATVIGHAGFRTLMHEFGHALHALLSNTKYQHLSGTRCEMDFMETPSLLLERLAWDPNILRLLDEKQHALSDNDLTQLSRHRLAGLSALDVQEQVLCSLFDLEVCSSSKDDENELWWRVRNDFGSFQVPADYRSIRKEVYFHHFIGTYAGSFYAYPWSNAIALDVYRELFAGKNNDYQAAGSKVKEELLIRGGSRDPRIVLHGLIGRRTVDETALTQDLLG